MARDGYLSVGDAAKLLGLTRQGVHARINAGRYRKEEVLEEGSKQKRYEIPVEDIRQDLPAGEGEERIGGELEEKLNNAALMPRRREDFEVISAGAEALKEIRAQLQATWQINGDVVRLLERQLELKDQSLVNMEVRCKDLERYIAQVLEERKQILERLEAKDSALEERIEELEQGSELTERRSWWRRIFG